MNNQIIEFYNLIIHNKIQKFIWRYMIMSLEEVINQAVAKIEDSRVMLTRPMQAWNHG